MYDVFEFFSQISDSLLLLSDSALLSLSLSVFDVYMPHHCSSVFPLSIRVYPEKKSHATFLPSLNECFSPD